MIRLDKTRRIAGLAVTTALASAMLVGCSGLPTGPVASANGTAAAPVPSAQNLNRAVAAAERNVQAEPRNAAYRSALGAAYLDAGRFASAATSFDDAMKLGDNSPRTALSLALALMGQGKMRDSAALLNDWDTEIATADLGLALALAGQPERGVHLMGNAIRNGENTPKMRQNLAYAYALSGRWREARLMAGQDVPADKLGERMSQWAELAVPEAWQQRVAAMLGVPANVRDAGQPTMLALANSPGVEQLVAEASAQAAPGGELPSLAAAAPVSAMAQAPALPRVAATPMQAAAELPPLQPVAPQVAVESYPAPQPARPANFQAAFATSGPAGGSLAAVTQDAMRFAQAPAVQAAPLRQGAEPAAVPARAARSAGGSHLVQLGSFASEQGARRAWGIYVKNHPELAGHEMVISQAVVKGRNFWRVAAAGFGRADSGSVCGKVKSRGQACIAYAEGRPLPGAVASGLRMARR